MEPVRVHQHLELDDVLAFGMGAADLVILGAGALLGSWVYLHLVAPMGIRLCPSLMVVATGALLGPARIGDRSLRSLAVVALMYTLRPRLLLYGGEA